MDQKKRFALDCREAGEKSGGCSVSISGTYDEVLDVGVSHGMKSHGMSGSESEVREDIKSYIKEESSGFSGAPTRESGSFQGTETQKGGAASQRPS